MSEETRTETALAAPEFDLQARLREHRLYLKACRLLLNDEDYAVIKGRKFRKRSGWAKLRKAFAISTEIIRETRLEIDDDWGYLLTVRGYHPSGRFEEADGAIMASEIEREMVKAAVKRNNGQAISQERIADIRADITLHDVRAKALTRGKNRVTSDILGAGVVSAEEAAILKAHWIDDPVVCKRFWSFAKGVLKRTEQQVYDALGVKRVHDFAGTMKEAKAKLEEAAIGPDQEG